MEKQKTIIGRTTEISLVADGNLPIPAKIDTGADGSSIWASEFSMDETGHLSYCLFAKDSQYYTGKRHTAKTYQVSAVRSAHGSLQVRYKIKMSVIIEGRKVKGTFTLADRSQNTFPVLIGCRLLNKKFIVDVSKGKHYDSEAHIGVGPFNQEFKKDPVSFFKKYHHENERGDI